MTLDKYKMQVIAALEAGNLEEVKRLQPNLKWEAAANKWLSSYMVNGKGSIPIEVWIEPNPLLIFGNEKINNV